MDASVIIPTKNRRLSLLRCLRALADQETARRFEVIVVDDGSSPPIRAGDLPALPAARVISSGGVGPAGARNRGVEAAAAPFVLFTDDDTAPAPHWVEAACAFLEAHPDYLGVEGPTLSPPFDPLYERSVENHHAGAYWTCNMGYRRDVFGRLGGFSDLFPKPHCEDLDLGFRALDLGPVGFLAEMTVTHFPEPVTMANLIRRARLASSEVLLHQRHPERMASRVPVRLRPLVNVLRWCKVTIRREGLTLVRRPRRLARFSVLAIGWLTLVTADSFRGSPHKPAVERK